MSTDPDPDLDRAHLLPTTSGGQISVSTAATLRREVEEAIAIHEASEHDLQIALRRQLVQLEGQEDRLIEMVSDGDLPVPKLKARLRAVSLQRDHLKERLARVDDELARGSAQVGTYLDLLSNVSTLYEQADDLTRRQLFEAFFPPLPVDLDDDLIIEGEAHAAVRALSATEGLRRADTNESEPPPDGGSPIR